MRCWKYIHSPMMKILILKKFDSVMDYSGQFKLRLPRSLHKSLANRSRQEGISMNQYCLYLLAGGVNKPKQDTLTV